MVRTNILFLIAFSFVTFAVPKCPKYLAGNFTDGCSSSKIKDNQQTFFVKACPKNKHCHYTFPDEPEKCSDSLPKQYPGSYCNTSNDCIEGSNNSTKCINNICVAENENCEYDYDCNPGFYCKPSKNISIYEKGKCTELVGENKPCSLAQPCHTSLVCSMEKCVRYGSINIKEKSTAASSCKTFYESNGECKFGPKLANAKNSTRCPESGVCLYSNAPNKPCRCGMNGNGDSYCNPGAGDLDPKPVIFH